MTVKKRFAPQLTLAMLLAVLALAGWSPASAAGPGRRENVVFHLDVQGQPTTEPADEPPPPAVDELAETPATAPSSQPTTAEAEPPPEDDAVSGDAAHALYDKGRYARAAAVYRRLLEAESPPLAAALGLADALHMQGRYADALAALDSLAEAGRQDARWHTSRAVLLSTVGRYDDAVAAGRAALAVRPDHAPAILALGRAMETLGGKAEAQAVYKTIEKTVAGEAFGKDAETLVAVGQVLDRLSVLEGRRASEQAANILRNYLQRSYVEADKTYWPGRVAAGMFLLSKHMPEQAMQEFSKANDLNPKIPEVALGVAAVHLENWQFEQAEKIIAEGLEVNPHHAELHLARAQVLMQWRKFDAVAESLDEALAVNPNHIEALSLAAALRIRLDDEAGAQPYLERIEAIHRGPCAGTHLIIGDWLSAARRFAPAEQHLRRAGELAPELAGPYAQLALVYLQRGMEEQALEQLHKAHAIDNFRADVVNYINLIQSMQRDFVSHQSEHFIVKVHRDYDRVLLKAVAEYMEAVRDEICGDFNYWPKDKTLIEIFPTHQGFSLRIAGKGWIGTVGASTGQVIVLAVPDPQRSPQFGRFNWATVLRHEYTHTVTLEATDNRIPHWFTEALAVFQQPDRRDFESVRLLVDAVRRDRLFTVEEMDWGFIRPRRSGDRSLAYAQAEWTAEYIIAAHGYETIIRMLEGFRDGLTQAQVFERALGTTEGRFNDDFRAWAVEQVRSWGIDPSPPPELAAARKAVEAAPQDAAAQGRLARAWMARGRRSEADAAARKALALQADAVDALAVLARLAMADRQFAQAAQYAERLAQADPANALAPRILAEAALEQKQYPQAIAALEARKARQPLDGWAYEQLAKLFSQLGQAERALPNLLAINAHNLRDPQIPKQIAEIYRELGQADQAMTFYAQVLQINPYDATVYRTLATLALRRRQYEQAIGYAQAVTQLSGDLAESWADLAAVCYRAGVGADNRDWLSQALQAADKAVELDGSSPAVEIRARVREILGD